MVTSTEVTAQRRANRAHAHNRVPVTSQESTREGLRGCGVCCQVEEQQGVLSMYLSGQVTCMTPTWDRSDQRHNVRIGGEDCALRSVCFYSLGQGLVIGACIEGDDMSCVVERSPGGPTESKGGRKMAPNVGSWGPLSWHSGPWRGSL